jgi:hypothetical protein
MKKLLVALVIATVLVSCAKERVSTDDSSLSSSSASRQGGRNNNIATPPQAVLSAFVANFGNVAVREWKLRSDGTWRAHFTRNGVAWEATFTSNGTLVKSEPA